MSPKWGTRHSNITPLKVSFPPGKRKTPGLFLRVKVVLIKLIQHGFFLFTRRINALHELFFTLLSFLFLAEIKDDVFWGTLIN